MQSLKRAASSPAAAVSGWLVLLVSCYPSLWSKDGAGAFKLDAWIYYHAVAQWHGGGSLYDWYANPADRLWPFTYPPFAAAALTPLTWGSDRTAQVLLVVATPVCAVIASWAALRALGVSRAAARGGAAWMAAVGVLMLEPLPKTMEYGQVNAILMAMVAVDLLVVPSRSPWRGVLSGLAAAFKLTPAIAVLVLLVRREWRAAATLTGTAAAVTAACWAIWPRESAAFFGSAMWDPGRAGFADFSGNQNLKGLVARWLPEAAWTPVWAVSVLIVLAGAVALLKRISPRPRHAVALLKRISPRARPASEPREGRRPRGLRKARGPQGPWSRRDPWDPESEDGEDGLELVLGVVVTMATGLLISPISWSHHWVWCLPMLLALAQAARRWDSPALWVTTAVGVAVFSLAMQWWFPEQNHVEQDWPLWATIPGSSYTLFTLAAGVVLWREAGRRRARADDAPAVEANQSTSPLRAAPRASESP